jgi:mannose-6-phosphate isomerase-like protein (cupin superfamily)
MVSRRGDTAEAAELRVISDLVTFLATSEQTDGAFTLFRSVTPPGAGVPPHRHAGVSEVCLVEAGEYTFLRSETIQRVGAGEVVCIVGGEIHAFTNTGRVPGQLLVIAAPGADVEAFCRAAGALVGDRPDDAPTSRPDIAQLISVAAQHGIELLPRSPPGLGMRN